MAAFLISYDLHYRRNYDRMHEAFREFGFTQVLESVWVGELDNSAVEVREWIRSLVDDDDSIFVIRLKPKHEWASRNLGAGKGEQLKQVA